MLRLVIGRMLADPRIFTAIGDTQEERSDLQPLRYYSLDADEMLLNNAMPMEPNNKLRAGYAYFLQDQALMFLIGHEIAHISRGHVDYLAGKYGSGFAAALDWFWHQNHHDLIERQCLEMDADGRSIVSRIDSLKLTSQDLSASGIPWAPTADVPDQLISDWVVSVNILFRLFGDIRFSHSELNSSGYPPIPIRRALCESVAWGAITQIWNDKLESVARRALQFGRNQVEEAFAHILGEAASPEGLTDNSKIASY